MFGISIGKGNRAMCKHVWEERTGEGLRDEISVHLEARKTLI